MPSIEELIQSAIQLHRGGELQEARQRYQQVLELEPRQPDALNLLGLLARQTGQLADAVEYGRRAIAADRKQAAYFANLGEAYRVLGQLDEAIKCYSEAIRLQPNEAKIHNHLGTLLQEAGRLDEALASYTHALRLDPQMVEAQFNIGTTLQQQNKLSEAAASYTRLLELNPNYVGPLANLGMIHYLEGRFSDAQACYERAAQLQPTVAEVHYNLGNVLQVQKQWDRAIACHQKAIQLKPDYGDAHCSLGSALRGMAQLDEALVWLRRAVELQPNAFSAHTNLGVVLQELGELDEAHRSFERALELRPDLPEMHFNLGILRKDQGDPLAAIACYEQALRLNPVSHQALVSRGTAFLSLGQFDAGWAGFEHRAHCPQFNTPTHFQPRWDGSPLDDRTLLIHCEQGLGDTLQFIRYVKLTEQRGGKIIIAAHPALTALLGQSGFRGLVSNDQPLPPFDVWVPLMSLPYVFQTEVDTVPSDVPYLAPEQARVERWRGELKPSSGLKVGIAWQGRRDHRLDRLRSMPLACFAPLAAVPGVRLLSLQKGAGSEQVAALGDRFELVDLASRLDNEPAAFLDTAAVMKSLDLVVTSDTAIAHLAGALGVRVWLALPLAPDWRWMFVREDSPWYPTMRLFRQSRFRQWSDVFERMAADLEKMQSCA
jgi:tetratricopeptide (TPR) repeat protein